MTASRALTSREEVVEVIARALASGPFKRDCSVEIVASWLTDAEDILAALEAAGVRLVPAEATWKMCLRASNQWCQSDRNIYQAMCAASPYAPEDRA